MAIEQSDNTPSASNSPSRALPARASGIGISPLLREAMQRHAVPTITPVAGPAAFLMPTATASHFTLPSLEEPARQVGGMVGAAGPVGDDGADMFPPTLRELESSPAVQQALANVDVNYLQFKSVRMEQSPRWPFFSAPPANSQAEVPVVGYANPEMVDFGSAFRLHHEQSGVKDRVARVLGFDALEEQVAPNRQASSSTNNVLAAPAPAPATANGHGRAKSPPKAAVGAGSKDKTPATKSKRPRDDVEQDELVSPQVQTPARAPAGPAVPTPAPSSPMLRLNQDDQDAVLFDDNDEAMEEVIEEAPPEQEEQQRGESESPRKKRKTIHLIVEPVKDPGVAISKAAKLIDELVTEWDDLDTFQPDAAVAAMQDAHQLENAQKQTTEASAKKHFISREVSSSTGGIGALLSADALHKLANAMDRVNEVGKMGELPEGIEGGSQALVKILQMLDGWLRSGSMSFSLVEKKKKRQGEEDDEEEEDEDEEDLGTKLAEAKASVEAAYVVLAIMSGGAGKLERRMFSEDLLVSLLELLKAHLQQIIQPFVQGVMSSDHDGTKQLTKWINANKALLVAFTTRVGDCLSKLGVLFSSRESLDESVVISATYAGLKPFFWHANNDPPKDSTRSTCLARLQLASLDLIRAVFAHHPARRNDVLTEIVTSLGAAANTSTSKQSAATRYQLPDGKTVNIWSALVLECLQSVCEMTDEKAKALITALAEDLKQEEESAAGKQAATEDEGTRKTPSKKKKKKKISDASEQAAADQSAAGEAKYPHMGRLLDLLRNPLDAATSSASIFMHYLVVRAFPLKEKEAALAVTPSRKGKKGAAGTGGRKEDLHNEAEYRSILDAWITDLCTLIDAPEWPVATMALLLATRLMTQVLEDTSQGRTAQSRQHALDLLGTLVARLRKREVLIRKTESIADLAVRFPETEVKDMDQESHFAALDELQRRTLSYLVVEGRKESAAKSAETYVLTDWIARLLANASSETDSASRVTSGAVVKEMFTALLQKLCAHARPVERLQLLATQTFEQVDREEAMALMALYSRNNSRSLFDNFTAKILLMLDSTSNQLRGKALKALGEIVTVDSSVLSLRHVRGAVEQRIHDPGPLVRDASIELVSKYAFLSKDLGLIREYFDVIAERASDTSTMVRKRAVRFLRDAFVELKEARDNGAKDVDMMVIACSVFINRGLADEETTVRDLALGALSDCWLANFTDSTLAALVRQGVSKEASGDRNLAALRALPPAARKELSDRLRTVVATTSQLLDKDFVGDAFTKMLLGKDHAAKVKICQLLVNGLVEEATTGDQENRAETLTALYQVTRADPSLVGPYLQTLHPFLKVDPKDFKDSEPVLAAVLGIYRLALPSSGADHDPAFVQRLVMDLFQLISKGNTGIVTAAVPCLCVLVNDITHDFDTFAQNLCQPMIIVMQASAKIKAHDFPKGALANVYRSTLVTGMLLRDIDFDKERTTSKKLDETITAGFPAGSMSVRETMFSNLLYLATLTQEVFEPIKAPALEALGNLFTTAPSFMTRPESRELMVAVFESGSRKMKQQLLTVLRILLDTESKRGQALAAAAAVDAGKGPVRRDILMGNAEELGQSTVGGGVMQTYLEHVLNVLTGGDDHLRSLAFDVIERTLEQGLVMPTMCIPALVAMECQDKDKSMRDRAIRLHTKLADKHPGFIHIKNQKAVRDSFDCLSLWSKSKWIAGARVAGPGDADAVLMPLYNILRPKKQQRTEFLRDLVKLFDVDLRKKDPSSVDVPFLKYVAENLASFNYEKQEEALTVIYYINDVISITATMVVRFFEELVEGQGQDEAEDIEAAIGPPDMEFMTKASKAMGMLLILRKFLQSLYRLSHNRSATFKPNEGAKSQERPIAKDAKVSGIIVWNEMEALGNDLTTYPEQMAQLDQFNKLMAADFVLMDEDGEGFLGDDVSDDANKEAVEGEDGGAGPAGDEGGAGPTAKPARKVAKPKAAPKKKRQAAPKGAKGKKPATKGKRKSKKKDSDSEEEMSSPSEDDEEDEPSSPSSVSDDDLI